MNEHEQPGDSPEQHEAQDPIDPPRIWVGSLADYNNGVLHGEWLAAAVDAEDLHQSVQAMLARSEQPEAEEWGIFDFEGFGQFRVGEYESLDTVAQIAGGIAQNGPAFAAWVEHFGTDEETLAQFSDAFTGHFESRTAYAQSIIDDLGIEESLRQGLPDFIAGYVSIDLEGIARDIEISGDVAIIDADDGGVWVFDARL
jgi:antirestriction protein